MGWKLLYLSSQLWNGRAAFVESLGFYFLDEIADAVMKTEKRCFW